MKIKVFLLLIFLGTLTGISQNDSIQVSIEDLRTITKMTEDLKYTKEELKLADSIIVHQREIINLKDQTIDLKNKEISDNLKKEVKKEVRVGIVSGLFGLIVGLVLGICL